MHPSPQKYRDAGRDARMVAMENAQSATERERLSTGDGAAEVPEASTVAFPEHVTATVRRGVNMRAFLVLGVVVGVIAAFVLTYAFPEHPDFSRGQILGFLLVFVTALSAIVFIGIGAIIEAIIGRKQRTIDLERADGETGGRN